MASAKLQPTLWRTSRVLANRTRLKIFAIVMREPGLPVTRVASRMALARPIASMYLRALESRGLLEVQRQGRWVKYRVKQKPMEGSAGPLVGALVATMRGGPNSFDALYRSAAVFANPGRIVVFRNLSGKPMSLAELRSATHLSPRTLFRHVEKLKARGFLTGRRLRGRIQYAARIPKDVFGRALTSMAKQT
jgi:DNA-binding transcriptional ArsR family regulator